MSNEFGPVDLTGVKPDKLPRLIDLPGVKELVKAAYRAGYTERDDWPCDKAARDWLADEYMKALEVT